MNRSAYYKLAILMAMGWLFHAPALAAQTAVWQIGQFDQSSHEFGGRFDYSNPSFHPVFRVGQSDASKNWPAEQPGSSNKSTGQRPYPYTILFSLPSPPKGTYRLVVSTILTHSRVPALQIDLNGKIGVYYFTRKVSYYAGNPGFDSPVYGTGRIVAMLPTLALHAGQNQLILTAVDDPKSGPGDSWLAYDALRLENSPQKPSASPLAQVKPTIFFVNRQDRLCELTQVTVSLPTHVRKGSVQLKVGTDQFENALSAEPGFGEQRFTFAIPKFEPGATASLRIQVNGVSHHSSVTLQPQRQWTLYVVPHAHLDIGFTDYQAKVAEVHDRNIDKLLVEIAQHPEMRFSLDGSWIVWHYLATRNKAARRQFMNDVKEGKIGVPVQYANLMTGYPTLEELIRSTAYSQRLHRQLGIPFEYANITDVPNYTWSYPSVLNALGVKYLAAASNNDRGPILLYGRWNERSPFWWQGPDGAKVLMSYSRQYFQLSFVCGVPATESACRESLPTFFQQYQSPSYKPDAVLMFGSQVENTDLIPGEPQFVAQWNGKYAYPHMILATFPDYFHYIEGHFGNQLETVTGDWSPYWEDGFGTDSAYGIINRANQQRTLSAEKLSSIATYLHQNLSGPRALIAALWDDLVLYSEHTFTSWGGYSRPNSDETVRQFEVKDSRVTQGRNALNAILDQSFSQMMDQIHIPAESVVVFNGLSWTRSSLVETDLNDGTVLKEYPSMKMVPFEVLRHEDGYSHIRFMATDVPSLGYKCYQVDFAGSNPATPGEVQLPLANQIENQFYRIEFDPAAGAIRSVFDKQLNKELVDPSSPYRFNQYIYVSGGNDQTQLVHFGKALPLAQLTPIPSQGGRVVGVRRTSYGQILIYHASGLHAPSITTDVILFDHEKKIEFINHLDKEPVSSKEAVDFAFPFAVSKPNFSYEIQNGWVNPEHDILKGGSLEWFTVQHWVRVANSHLAVGLVPIDAPLISLGDINRGTWPVEFKPKSSTVFSYVLNNYWHTNFRRIQSGKFTFRYALTSGSDLSPGKLSRFGREAMTPIELRHLISNDKFGNPPRPLTPNPTSFLRIQDPDVVLEDWKMAEDGNGTILRLLEIGGREVRTTIRFPLFSLQHVFLDDAREDDQRELSVSRNSVEVSLKPHQIMTLRVLATH